jgi:two-component system phosphate regulon sensor histidine kinase PhoR
MRNWFAVPLRDNEYETFAARVLHYTLLLLFCVALLFVFFTSSLSQLIFIPVMLGILGGCYYLLHTGRFRLSSLIFLIGFWLVITIASFSINGIRNASISSYAIVITYSAILLNNRAVTMFTGMSILAAAILAVGETQGMLPLRTTPLYLADRFFQQLALFGATGILLYAASRVIRTSFQRAQENQQALLERNQELEAQIAERQRTEANLRVSEEKYRLLFENTPVMAGVYAQDGEIILLNNAAAQTLGGTPETLRGRNLRDVLSAEDGEDALRDQAQVIAERRAKLIESDATLPNGREIYFLRHIMPLPNVAQVLVLTIDMTEKYRAEQRERELALARERNAFLAEFFSTLSHDLKTPLAVMTTSLYLLEHAQTAQQREEKTKSINEQIALMDSYIQDMLAISRLEHLPTFNFEMLDLNPLVEQVVDLLRPRMERKQLLCDFSAQPDLPPIRGDREQLRRMLTNLIENAVNYTSAGGQVNVKLYAANEHVALEVRDNGIGIHPDAVPHIFERFFRAPNARESESRGTGLGLAIVKKIVEAHKATIEVNSQPGEGTTFCIHFPIAPLH